MNGVTQLSNIMNMNINKNMTLSEYNNLCELGNCPTDFDQMNHQLNSHSNQRNPQITHQMNHQMNPQMNHQFNPQMNDQININNPHSNQINHQMNHLKSPQMNSLHAGSNSSSSCYDIYNHMQNCIVCSSVIRREQHILNVLILIAFLIFILIVICYKKK
jgi:hypothetical protein